MNANKLRTRLEAYLAAVASQNSLVRDAIQEAAELEADSEFEQKLDALDPVEVETPEGDTIVGTQDAPSLLANSAVIDPGSAKHYVLYCAGSGGEVTVTVADGEVIGQLFSIETQDDTNTVTVTGANLRTTGSGFVGARGFTRTWRWGGTYWQHIL